MDIYKEGSSTPIIEYEVYDPKTKNQLNLRKNNFFFSNGHSLKLLIHIY